MLESLAKNLKGNRRVAFRSVTAWLIFGAIILVFVFFGLTPQHQGVTEGGAAITVNGHSISMAEFNQVVENMRRDPRFEQLQALGGDAGRQILQNQAVSQMVDVELIRQATEKLHVSTTDAEVRSVLLEVPVFQENGKFSSTLYKNYLTAVGKTPAELENEIRRQQSLQRVVRMFAAGLQTLPLEQQKLKDLAGIKTNLAFVSVPTDALVIPESVPEAKVAEYLKKPENETKVADYFKSHPQEFSTPEQVKVQHILLRTKPDDEASDKAALTKIEDIAKRAKTEDFGKLAGQFSEDPGSKSKGGTIDFFTRGKMVPQFEEVAFAAPLNEVSKPVKTDYGYHLIKVVAKKPAQTRTLDQARKEIAQQLIAKEESAKALEGLQADLQKGDAPAIQKFVADHKLKWDETGAFDIQAVNIPKIGPNDEVARLAFSLNPAKPFASTLVREGGRAFLLQHKAVAEKTVSTDKAPTASQLEGRAGEQALQVWIEGLRKTAEIATNPAITGRARPE